MRTLASLCLVLILGLSIAFGACKASAAEEAAEFYKGKMIETIVPMAPGASYDAYARILAPYLEKHTGAKVVVKNMPGAGGALGTNHLYKTAKRDGTVIACTSGYLIVAGDVLKGEGVKWRASEFNWLGRIGDIPNVLLVSAKLPYKSLADLQKAKGLRFAASAVGSSSGDFSAGIIEALGLDAKIVVGYGGMAEACLAVIRGEADLVPPSIATGKVFVDSGDLRALALLGVERSRILPDLPILEEQVPLSGMGKLAYQFRGLAAKYSYVIVAPPGVPKDRVAFLREAVAKAAKEKGLIAAGDKQNRFIAYLSGPEIEAAIKEILERTPEERATIRRILREKYFE